MQATCPTVPAKREQQEALLSVVPIEAHVSAPAGWYEGLAGVQGVV